MTMVLHQHCGLQMRGSLLNRSRKCQGIRWTAYCNIIPCHWMDLSKSGDAGSCIISECNHEAAQAIGCTWDAQCLIVHRPCSYANYSIHHKVLLCLGNTSFESPTNTEHAVKVRAKYTFSFVSKNLGIQPQRRVTMIVDASAVLPEGCCLTLFDVAKGCLGQFGHLARRSQAFVIQLMAR